jgi:predicted dehydrogenase
MGAKEIKFGIVGAGRIAQDYVRAFEKCQDVRVMAVADICAGAAASLAEKLKCRSYDSYERMADETGLDAVLVCTPPAIHPDVCLQFLSRKVHVLCEKPLCIDLPSAIMILETARREDVLLTMASKFRFVKDIVKAKSIISSGILGDILLFENTFSSQLDMAGRWNSDPAISGGGVLIDNGTHSVDIVRYFLGPLSEINVFEAKRSQGLSVEETVCLVARSVSGVLSVIRLSWSVNIPEESFIRVYGSKGTLTVGWKESKFRVHPSQEWLVYGNGYDKIEAFRNQIENFCNAVRGTEELLLTAEDALASVEVITAGYVSLRQKRWVPALFPRLANEVVTANPVG